MSIVLRPGTAADAAACGTICYEAFKAICTEHNFPPDFPSPEVASGVLSMLLTHPRFYSVVAEGEGRIVGTQAARPSAAMSTRVTRIEPKPLIPRLIR
jgi:hypothetical protein